MSTPHRPTPPRPGIPPRPLSVPPLATTLPSTPPQGFASSAASAAAAAAVSQPSGAQSASPQPASTSFTSPASFPQPAPVPMDLLAGAPLSRDWYVYQPDGRHIGPVSTTFLARNWLSGQVPRDVFVGAAGDPSWRPLWQVIEIMDAVNALQQGRS